jgi:hypothetical protein
MAIDIEFGRMWETVFVAYFKAASQNLEGCGRQYL